MNLERMRSVLETLARSFTGRDTLCVHWGDVPYTDFKKIVLPRDAEIVPGVKCTPGELWLGLKANCAHESGHLIFTDKNVWGRYKDRPLHREVLNIIEDARVERGMANLFPGTLRWFRFLNEYVFLHRKDWTEMPPHEQALYGLACYTIVGRLPEGLSVKELEFVSECAPIVDEGRISETTEGAAAAAEKVVEVFIKHYGDRLPSRVRAPETCGTPEPREAPRGGRDPRRKPALPKVEREEPAPGEKEPQPPKPEDEERPAEEPMSDESLDERRDADEADEAESEAEPEPEFGELHREAPGESIDTEQPEADGSGDAEELSEGETESTEDAADAVEPSEGPDSEATEPEEPKEEEPGLEPETEPETDDALPEPTDELETEAPPEPEDDADTESEDADMPRGGTLESPGTPGGGDSSEALEDADTGDVCEPGESVEETEDLLTGMDDLMEESEREVRAFRDEPEITIPEPSREEIEEAGRAGLMKHRLVLEDLPPDPKRREYYEKKLRPLAHRAAEEVRKILQGRHSVVRRNLRKGNLDPSALWKVPTGEPDIFRKRDLPGPNADIAVYLLIDCSASMGCYAEGPWTECKCRMDYAAYAAILLHLMCRELNIPHAATGFTTCPGCYPKEDVLHFRVRKFSDPNGAFEGMFAPEFRYAMSNNVDGFSIRAAAKELSVRPEENKILFVISDGYPDAREYHGTKAFKDTAVAVREAERMGIRVVGVYIGDDRSSVRALYPNLISLSAGDLPVVLARTLKRVITGPV